MSNLTKEQVLLEYVRCQKDVEYALKTYLQTFDNTVSKFVPLELFPDQLSLLNDYEEYNENIALKYRQAGVSTVTAAWVSRKLVFAKKTKPEKILIIANKLDTAVEMANKIRGFISQWPSWTGIEFSAEKNSTKHYKLNNGCEVKAVATSKDALRGFTPTILIFDEAAYIDADSDFWAACMASLSTGGKVVVISCVTKDTYVFTNNGLEQISDYIDTKSPIGVGYFTENYEIRGKDGVRKSNILLNNGKQKTKKIRTLHSSIEGTHTHKVWGFSKNKNEYGWYCLSELNVGDYINVGFNFNMWGNNDKIDYFYEPSNKENNVFITNEITNEIAYFLGLFLAEGSVYQKFNNNGVLIGSSITITCGDDISELLSKINLKYYQKDGIHYNISSKSLFHFLKEIGFDFNLKSKSKVIPKKLLSLSKEKTKFLLRGLFDGNGFSDKNRLRIGIGLSSKEMINQIRMLLLNFGILTDYHEVNTKPTKKVKVHSMNYRISAIGKNADLFYEEIGFGFERKNKKRIKYNPKKDSFDIIPNGSKILLDIISTHKIRRKNISKNNLKIWDQLKKVENLSRKSFEELFSEICELTNIINKNYIYDKILIHNSKWDKIKLIEDSENETFDFSLYENPNDFWCHSIYYNGYLGHQTPNGYDPIYYEIYDQALRNMNDFKISEMYWYKDPRYTEDLFFVKTEDIIHYLLNKEDYSQNLIIDWSKKSFKERDYEELKNLMKEGYKPCSTWFERMVKKLKYDKRKISQELECNFLGSGDNVFESSLMQNIKENMITEPSVKMMGNSLWIWKEPVPGHKYIMGCDLSRGDSEDYSSFQIIDFDEREQVAEYVGKIPPDIMADIAYKWGNMYSCFIVIDITGGMGVSTSRKLQEMGYNNLYVDGTDLNNKWKYDPKKAEKIPGINFNNKRIQIIASYEEAIRHGFKIYSSRLFNEMNSFVFINGRPDHQKGQHDDLIMSISMAIYVGESSFMNLTKVTEHTKAMIDSWTVNENSNSRENISFNPVIPNNAERINQYGSQNLSKDDYRKYGWLFGVK